MLMVKVIEGIMNTFSFVNKESQSKISIQIAVTPLLPSFSSGVANLCLALPRR